MTTLSGRWHNDRSLETRARMSAGLHMAAVRRQDVTVELPEPPASIARFADLFQQKAITPEGIPLYDREAVQVELIRRWLLRRRG